MYFSNLLKNYIGDLITITIQKFSFFHSQFYIDTNMTRVRKLKNLFK